MDKAEAILAVELNAICVSGGVRYYACGNERTKMPGKPPRESIILHDMKENSITHAELETTSVLDWKASPLFVETRLRQIRARQQV